MPANFFFILVSSVSVAATFTLIFAPMSFFQSSTPVEERPAKRVGTHPHATAVFPSSHRAGPLEEIY